MRVHFRTFLAGMTLALGIVMTPAAVAAQTIGQTTTSNTNFGNIQQGQSFTATVTGTVTQIAVRPSDGVAGDTLRIYNAPNGSGAMNNPGTPAYTQTVTLVSSSNSAALQTITLSTPFPVVAGNSYSFIFENSGLWISDGQNPYAGGDWIYDYSVRRSNADAAFQVVQVAAPPPAPVPTMTEWAMILFGTILAGGAALYVQRRQQLL